MARDSKSGQDAANESEADRSGSEAEETPREGGKRARHIVTGAALGIGSAALVAALLYANRSRKSEDRK